MMKLTQKRSGTSVYVSLPILAMVPSNGGGTELFLGVGGLTFVVKESISEILALPEMVRHENPLYMIPSLAPGSVLNVSSGLDKAITEELQHPPGSIMGKT